MVQVIRTLVCTYIIIYSYTPRPPTALLMCLEKYSTIGNSAIGNYEVVYRKLTLETVPLEVHIVKND